MSASTRTISAKEYNFALQVFQREFPEQNRITIVNDDGLDNRAYVRPTVDGEIKMFIKEIYKNPLLNVNSCRLFLHELTHVWQIEHFGLLWSLKQAFDTKVLSGDEAYDYTCDISKTLADYNSEQQAQIVMNSYLNPGSCEEHLVQRALSSTTWKIMIGSSAVDVAVDSDGTAYLVNSAGKIYKYNGDEWLQLAGSDGTRISANNGKIYLINKAGKIYRYNGS